MELPPMSPTMSPTMLWTGRSTNRKTGDIPQGYVGLTREETASSCEGCPLLASKTCYHWTGTPRLAQSGMQRAAARGKNYTLAHALASSVRSARYVRGAVGGDPSPFSREQVAGWFSSIRSAGLKGLLLYTHFYASKGEHLRGLAMASVGSLEAADEAIAAGWRAAVVLPARAVDATHHRVDKTLPVYEGEQYTTPAGHSVVVCPAQRPGSYKTCNSCGLCDATKAPRVKAIGFLHH